MRALMVLTVLAAKPSLMMAQAALPQPLPNVYEARFRDGTLFRAQLTPLADPQPHHLVYLRSERTPSGTRWAVYETSENGAPVSRWLPAGTRMAVAYYARFCFPDCLLLFHLFSLQQAPAGPTGGRLAHPSSPGPLTRGVEIVPSKLLQIALPPTVQESGAPSDAYCRSGSVIPLNGTVTLLTGLSCMRLDVGPLQLPDGRVFSLSNNRVTLKKGGATLGQWDGWKIQVLLDAQGTPWILEKHGSIR